MKATDRLVICLLPAACGKSFDPKIGAPPPAQVFETSNTELETVENPEQFPLRAADQLAAAAQYDVTVGRTPTWPTMSQIF